MLQADRPGPERRPRQRELTQPTRQPDPPGRVRRIKPQLPLTQPATRREADPAAPRSHGRQKRQRTLELRLQPIDDTRSSASSTPSAASANAHTSTAAKPSIADRSSDISTSDRTGNRRCPLSLSAEFTEVLGHNRIIRASNNCSKQ